MKYWNKKINGLVGGMLLVVPAIVNRFWDLFTEFFLSRNIGMCGRNVTIQKGVVIRYPRNVVISNNVSLGRYVSITSELESTKLFIGKDTQINKNVCLDYTGNLIIGKKCIISEDVLIETHDHGYDAKSPPFPRELHIENNVWIGARAVILPKVCTIGENSIIAAGSIVTKPVERNVIIAGNPARIIKQLPR